MQARWLVLRLAAATALLALSAGCDRSLLHDLPDPLPANAQASTCAPAPNGLVAIAHEDRVELSWTDNADGSLKYVVERRSDAGFEDLTAPLAATAYADTVSLERDTLYGYRVRGESEGCTTAASEPIEVLSFPHPPAGLTANGNDDGVELSWDDVNEHETAYRVELVEGESVTTLATLPADATSWLDEGLEPDTVRRYRVVAVNASGEAGDEIEGGSRPRAPTDLVAIATGPNRVGLSWTDTNENESGYRVYRVAEGEEPHDTHPDAGPGSEHDEGHEVLVAELPADATSYEDESAGDSRQYTYSVTAFNASGESERATTSIVTPCAEGSAPTDILVFKYFPEEDWSAPLVRFSWSSTQFNEFEWRLERKAPGDTDFLELESDSRDLIDEGAAPDTRYTYRIRGHKRTCFVVSDEVEVVTPIPPIRKDEIVITPLSDVALRIEWSDTFENESGFGVYLFESTDSSGSFPRLDSSPAADETTIVVENLLAGHEYTVVVVPEVPGSLPLARPSEEILAPFAAKGWTLTSPPTNVMVSTLSGSALQIDVGSFPFGAHAVRVERVGGPVVGELTGPGTLVDEGLLPGTKYEYDVFGVNDAGLSLPFRTTGDTYSAPNPFWTDLSKLQPVYDSTCTFVSEGDDNRDRELRGDVANLHREAEVVTDPLGSIAVGALPTGVEVTLDVESYFRRPFTVRWEVSDLGGSASIDRTIVLDIGAVENDTMALDSPYAFGPGVQPHSENPPPPGCNGPSCFGRAASVSVGDNHSCVRDEDERLWCWGANAHGALGDGTFENASNPTQVCSGESCAEPFEGVSAVAAGRAGFTCAVREGDLFCWGDEEIGVTGPESGSNDSHPEVPIASGVSSVSAGLAFACFIVNHEVYCLGQNNSNVLGAPGPASRTPVRVCLEGGNCDSALYASVTTGDQHACAVTTEGRVHCWGNNDRGQLGTEGGPGVHVSAPVTCGAPDSGQCEGGELRGVRQVTAGREHTCAILHDRSVMCWGNNEGGRLARPEDVTQWNAPTFACLDETCHTRLDQVVMLAADENTCAIRQDQTLWCWGPSYGRYPQGLCESGFASACSEADPAVLAMTVEVGDKHLCFVEPSGRVRCIGEGSLGRLGDGTSEVGSRLATVCKAGAGEDCVPFDDAAVMVCGEVKPFEVTP